MTSNLISYSICLEQ